MPDHQQSVSDVRGSLAASSTMSVDHCVSDVRGSDPGLANLGKMLESPRVEHRPIQESGRSADLQRYVSVIRIDKSRASRYKTTCGIEGDPFTASCHSTTRAGAPDGAVRAAVRGGRLGSGRASSIVLGPIGRDLALLM